jgi:glycosyltransferase involved in cell wall biosynthesis
MPDPIKPNTVNDYDYDFGPIHRAGLLPQNRWAVQRSNVRQASSMTGTGLLTFSDDQTATPLTDVGLDLDVGAVVITLNEAHDIGACLESVAWCNDMVVVDSGSIDDTLAIARRQGARIVTSPWQGFGPQKNKGVESCTRTWVLSIDADERITPALQREIVQWLKDCPPDIAGFEIPRRSQFCGKWVRYSGWSPDYTVRLFRRANGKFTNDRVHEHVEITGRTVRLRNCMEHFSYKDRAEVREKTLRYGAAGALALSEKGYRPAWYQPALHAAFAFCKTLILKRGVLDGRTGFSIALMNARTGWLKYSLLGEPDDTSDPGWWCRCVQRWKSTRRPQ